MYGRYIRYTSMSLLLLALTAGSFSAVSSQETAPKSKRPISQRHRDPSGFPWPAGAKAAVSLSFDDGLASQINNAVPLLDSFQVKATFYAQPDSLVEQLELWQQAMASGHEIGNHSLGHPCTGNFAWVRYDGVALESYTLERMRDELQQANDDFDRLIGTRPTSFAYPCGQTFVGRGLETRSYVPLVAEMFQTGRRWLDETSNAPAHFDPSQVMSMRMDREDFDTVRRMIERAKRSENWLVLAGHSVREANDWGTDLQMLRELLAYGADPANGIWIAPVTEVATFIVEERAKRQSR
ncbi:MAG: polysaccharide deacetylase family protein [Gemmatimonadetes bacterium]|jgi:peptidoglycan-N-acetylglucosamine deacetylase|nr:polysaccharide deacetylase family protein [Gemmatimonadota bacterium]